MTGMCFPKHDFCFTLPWGGLVVVFGVLGFLLKKSVASLMSGGGIGLALVATGVGSLKSWSSGKSSAPWTTASALVTAALANVMWKKYLSSFVLFPSGILAFTSAFMLAFYAKNLFVARRQSSEDDERQGGLRMMYDEMK